MHGICGCVVATSMFILYFYGLGYFSQWSPCQEDPSRPQKPNCCLKETECPITWTLVRGSCPRLLGCVHCLLSAPWSGPPGVKAEHPSSLGSVVCTQCKTRSGRKMCPVRKKNNKNMDQYLVCSPNSFHYDIKLLSPPLRRSLL